MKTIQRLKLFVILGGMMTMSTIPAQAGDILFFDVFRMFADRSTLVVEIGNYQGKFAMKVSFGQGIMAIKQIGIVYKETLSEDNAKKIDAAVAKLSSVLNDPKTTMLRIDKELSSDLGVTFEEFVQPDQIK